MNLTLAKIQWLKVKSILMAIDHDLTYTVDHRDARTDRWNILLVRSLLDPDMYFFFEYKEDDGSDSSKPWVYFYLGDRGLATQEWLPEVDHMVELIHSFCLEKMSKGANCEQYNP